MGLLNKFKNKFLPKLKINTDDNLQDDNEKLNHKEIVKNLNGRTLMIYFVLLNKQKTGVRELQRHLELSSPSVARYHLDKLTDLNLVDNRNGVYHLIRKAEIPALTSWILIGHRMLPRSIFMAMFTTLFFLGYLIFIFTYLNKDSFIMVLFSGILLIYLWMDVWWHFQNKPF